MNGYLNEDIHVYQPKGFEKAGEEEKVYKLQNALYGLRQTLIAWYSRLDSNLMDIGFSKSLNVATLYVKYVKSSGSDMLIVLIYVGDILIIGNKETEVEDIKGRMRSN